MRENERKKFRGKMVSYKRKVRERQKTVTWYGRE